MKNKSWTQRMKDPEFHNKYELNTSPAHGGTYVPKGHKVTSVNARNPNRSQNTSTGRWAAEEEVIDLEQADTWVGRTVNNGGENYLITGVQTAGYPAAFTATDSVGTPVYLPLLAVMHNPWNIVNPSSHQKYTR
jgi:hypothetical protein